MPNISDWKQVDVTVHTRGGTRTVNGHVNAAYPGLAITPSRSFSVNGLWSVTHIASGKAFGPDADTLLNAGVAVAELATAGDWTRTHDELKADVEFRERARAIRASLAERSAFETVERPTIEAEHV